MAVRFWGRIPLRAWEKMSSRLRSKYLRTFQGNAMFWITRRHKREIGTMALDLRVPPEMLRKHFELLRERGVGARDIGDKMIEDLHAVRELEAATNVDPLKLRASLKHRGIEATLQEMREQFKAQQQQGMQQGAAAHETGQRGQEELKDAA